MIEPFIASFKRDPQMPSAKGNTSGLPPARKIPFFLEFLRLDASGASGCGAILYRGLGHIYYLYIYIYGLRVFMWVVL